MSESVPVVKQPPVVLIRVFGAVLSVVLLSLPFLIFHVMARTQNQAQGMTLAGAAGLPLPAASLRCTVRENRDKSLVAARYELSPETLPLVASRLVPTASPDDALTSALARLAPRESAWLPDPASRGPWRTASGESSGVSRRVLLDESVGVLWIHSERR